MPGLNCNRACSFRLIARSLALAIGVCIMVRTGLHADDRVAKRDVAAVRLFRHVVYKYQRLPNYSDDGAISVSFEIDGELAPGLTQREKLQFSRPNRLVYTTPGFAVIRDGMQTFVVVPERSVDPRTRQIVRSQSHFRYMEFESPLLLKRENLLPIGAGVFGDLYAQADAHAETMPTFILWSLLLDEAPESAIVGNAGVLRLEPDRERSGRTLRCLFIERKRGTSCRLFVDPATSLILRIEPVWNDNGPGRPLIVSPPGKKVRVTSYSWDAGEVSIGPVEKSVFEVTQNRNYTIVDSNTDLKIMHTTD